MRMTATTDLSSSPVRARQKSASMDLRRDLQTTEKTSRKKKRMNGNMKRDPIEAKGLTVPEGAHSSTHDLGQ